VILSLFAALAATTALPSADPAVTQFEQLCLSGRPTPDILSAADHDGWHRPRPSASASDNLQGQRVLPGSSGDLTLTVRDENSAGEARQVCRISAPHAVPGLGAQLQNDIGLPPVFHAGPAATFFAIRSGEHWLPGTDEETAAPARRDGRYFSIMTDEGNPSSLMALRVTALVPIALNTTPRGG